MTETSRIRALLARLSRFDAADGWRGDLNPAQRTALDYLSRANRFSRAPSRVAEYLGTTRGTASQTLKALMRKGYVEESPVVGDKRSIHYALTPAGRDVVQGKAGLETALEALSPRERAALGTGLEVLLAQVIAQNGARPFGLCRTCRHHLPGDTGGHCALLDAALTMRETYEICHEHAPA